MRLTPEREKEIRELNDIDDCEYCGNNLELLAEIDALREELLKVGKFNRTAMRQENRLFTETMSIIRERDTLKAALELAKTALQYGDYSYNVSQIDADREDKTFREALDAIDASHDKAGK